jgi:hypothetical protein
VPVGDGGEFQEAFEVGEAFDFGGHDGGLDVDLLAHRGGAPPLAGSAGARLGGVGDFALANESRGEF